jgi:hypothetical protein
LLGTPAGLRSTTAEQVAQALDDCGHGEPFHRKLGVLKRVMFIGTAIERKTLP